MAIITSTTFTKTKSFDDSGNVSGNTVSESQTTRAILVYFNNLLADIANNIVAALTDDVVLTTATLSIGTTVTIAATASTITINGVPALVAALTAQAFGSLGTIPTAKWGVIAMERIAAGTATFTSGAANYTTGYNTEPLAIAALPAQSADKVRVGYVTILAASPGWVAGTDALAGGSGGTPATTTNYYSTVSVMDTTRWTTDMIGDMTGTRITT